MNESVYARVAQAAGFKSVREWDSGKVHWLSPDGRIGRGFLNIEDMWRDCCEFHCIKF